MSYKSYMSAHFRQISAKTKNPLFRKGLLCNIADFANLQTDGVFRKPPVFLKRYLN